MVTELMIFSVRAPRFVLLSPPPSMYLVGSVFTTLILGGLLAGLLQMWTVPGADIGWIILFNVGAFLLVDLMKLLFRKIIREEPGDVIANDELLVPTSRTETQKTVEKGRRYRAHRESIVSVADRSHCVEVKSRSSLSGFFSLGGEVMMDNGFVNVRKGVSGLAGEFAAQTD